MKNVHIDYQGPPLDFPSASFLAKEVARSHQMQVPTVISWHHNTDQSPSPTYEGVDPETGWAKYGAGNGGRLEVCIGDEFQFVMMDARGYEEIGEMPLRNLIDGQGNHYLCYTPILGMFADKPNPEACTHLDGWAADQY